MAIDLLKLVSNFPVVNDREGSTATFRTHVPWVAPLAYLHIIFKPPAREVLLQVARELDMPTTFSEFLQAQNGAILFSNALTIYGVHGPGPLLNRREPFSRQPINIADYQIPELPQFLSIGFYTFDGSCVGMARDDGRVCLFPMDMEEELVLTPAVVWRNLEQWITSEVERLSALFDSRGKLLVDESYTLPASQGSSS